MDRGIASIHDRTLFPSWRVSQPINEFGVTGFEQYRPSGWIADQARFCRARAVKTDNPLIHGFSSSSSSTEGSLGVCNKLLIIKKNLPVEAPSSRLVSTMPLPRKNIQGSCLTWLQMISIFHSGGNKWKKMEPNGSRGISCFEALARSISTKRVD